MSDAEDSQQDKLIHRFQDELVNLFELKDDIVTLIRDAGLQISDYDLDGSANNIWSGVVAKVKKQQRLEDLAKAALRQYPDNATFKELVKVSSALPAIWNIPQPRNLNFTGREDLLESIAEALKANKPAALTQAITGLGGIGKTQLAFEYVYRHEHDYKLVWWLRSAEAATLAADYAALARPLNLTIKAVSDQSLVIEAVRRYLENNTSWLLVFDNLEEPFWLRTYQPRANTGHILVTSRNPNWRGFAEPLTVEVFTKDEAVKFLLQRTGRSGEEATTGTLAKELGFLPLALEHAASYLERIQTLSLEGYLQKFKKEKLALLAKGVLSHDYHKDTIYTTWQVSLEKLPPAAAGLLNLLAFLAPDDIPLEIIRSHTEKLPESLARLLAADETVLDEAVADLRDYSLVKVSENGELLTIHRLLQAVVQDSLDKAGTTLEWLGSVIILLNKTFPEKVGDVRNWTQCALLVPHVLALGELFQNEMDVIVEKVQLLNRVGEYFWSGSEISNANHLLWANYNTGKKKLGELHPDVATTLNNLAGVLRAQGLFLEAREKHEQALTIRLNLYGTEHPAVAGSLNNLSGVLLALGELYEAKMKQEQALAIMLKEYGEDSHHVAISLNNLAEVLQALGDYEAAREKHEQALSILQKVHGKDSHHVAISLNNMAEMLQDLGEYEAARGNHEQALSILQNTYGEDSHHVAISLNNLAFVLQALGDFKLAKEKHEQALMIRVKIYGEIHPTVVSSLTNLAFVLDTLGNNEDANKYREQARQIQQKLDEKRSKTGE